jgi:hypothetical protein
MIFGMSSMLKYLFDSGNEWEMSLFGSMMECMNTWIYIGFHPWMKKWLVIIWLNIYIHILNVVCFCIWMTKSNVIEFCI